MKPKEKTLFPTAKFPGEKPLRLKQYISLPESPVITPISVLRACLVGAQSKVETTTGLDVTPTIDHGLWFRICLTYQAIRLAACPICNYAVTLTQQQMDAAKLGNAAWQNQFTQPGFPHSDPSVPPVMSPQAPPAQAPPPQLP